MQAEWRVFRTPALIQVKVSPMRIRQTGAMLTQQQLLTRFAERFLVDTLPGPSVSQFAAAGRSLEAAGNSAIRLDESCDQLVYLAEGATKLVARASGGREQVLGFHFPGDLVCVPARGAHAYTLFALRDTSLLTFCYDKVVELADENPAILRHLLDASRAALARSREKSIALGRKTAPERVACFLVAMAGRIGRTDGKATRFTLPMSRRDIADSMGVTIETVSRQLTELRKRGIIETSGRSQIGILDMATLTRGAGYCHAG